MQKGNLIAFIIKFIIPVTVFHCVSNNFVFYGSSLILSCGVTGCRVPVLTSVCSGKFTASQDRH